MQPQLPSIEEFCLEIPLYRTLYDTRRSFLDDLRRYTATLDFYCLECKQNSTFRAAEEPVGRHYGMIGPPDGDMVVKVFICSRDNSHKSYFIFSRVGEIVQKIGQEPSLASLVSPELVKYRKILGNERYRELTKAVGLTTHGVGIGAFVYLRRIFESLTEDAHQKAKSDAGWDESAYTKSRVIERIKILKDHLPDFLVKNAQLYSIMS